MHPNPAFRDTVADPLDRAATIGFAHLFAATPAGPMAVQAPVTRYGDTLRFHVARVNRITAHLDGNAVLVSVAEPHGYISPAWYVAPGNQVPTWNYVGVEVDGIAARLDEAALVEHLDALAALHEPRVNPAAPWTRGKMEADAFAAMLRGIVGFAVAVTAVRTTTKLSQNKPAADRAGVVAGLRASGNHTLAATMAGAA